MLILFLIPFVSALVMLLIPFSKVLGFALSLIPLVLLGFKITPIDVLWVPQLDIHFHLAVDSLSLIFLYLTAIVTPLTIAFYEGSSRFFVALILLLQGLLIGFFTAADLALFTIFWEAILFPLYFMIYLWGKEKREETAMKFLIYMIAGSALMITAVLAMYFSSSSFDLAVLKTKEGAPWILAVFLLAFAVKTPLFPFHGWLPDTYTQAPVSGTILLSALLSKAGIYGILRIALPLFPTLMKAWSPWLLGFAIAGVFYGGLAAWRQNDYKRLIAYSSFSHVNFILVGLFAVNEIAYSGAILQAFNHGITITALFLVAGWLEKRIGETHFTGFHGLIHPFPRLGWLTLFFVLASVALPGTNNFVGEFLIFFGLFGEHPWLTGFVGLTVILSVMYMLRWMQNMYFGPPEKRAEKDIGMFEWALALPLILIILWVGIYPNPFLEMIR